MTKIMEFYIDVHRKAIVNKVGNLTALVVLDSIPQALKRSLYEEVISFKEVDIVRRKLGQEVNCGNNRYRYTIFEEALCLKDQENCTTISYIVNIDCMEATACEGREIADLIRCLASSIKA